MPGVTEDRALCAPQRPFGSSSSQKLKPPLAPHGQRPLPGCPPTVLGSPWSPAPVLGPCSTRGCSRSLLGAVSVALWLQSGACGGHFVLSLLLSEPIKQEEKLKHAFCHQAAAAQAAGWELGAQRAPETPWEKSAPASPTPKPAAGVTRGDTGWGRCGMQSADTGFGDILSQGCGGTTPVCPLCPGDRQEPLVTALWWG